MIDRTHPFPLVRQCQVLALARSTASYQPCQVSPDELALMRRIDERHLNLPFAGSRMLSKILQREGQPVGRRRVSTLMKRMGIHALNRKSNTSKGIRLTRSIPICCAIWRSFARIMSGRRTSVRHARAVGERPTTPAGCRLAAGMLPRSGRRPGGRGLQSSAMC